MLMAGKRSVLGVDARLMRVSSVCDHTSIQYLQLWATVTGYCREGPIRCWEGTDEAMR
jgi:hypothetical protein